MTDPRPLASEEQGQGDPPWLFLHSLGGHRGFWKRALAHIGTRHRAVAVDLRGHRDSALAPDQSGATLWEHLNDVLATADALGLPQFVLVGHSFGATVALSVAAAAPKRVLGLVLVDASGSMGALPPDVAQEFLASIDADADGSFVRSNYEANLGRALPSTSDTVLTTLASTPRACLGPAYHDLLHTEPAALLLRYSGPTLLVADAENVSPFSLHTQVADHPVRLIDNTSHWIPLDQPDALNVILDEFDRSLAAADA